MQVLLGAHYTSLVQLERMPVFETGDESANLSRGAMNKTNEEYIKEFHKAFNVDIEIEPTLELLKLRKTLTIKTRTTARNCVSP